MNTSVRLPITSLLFLFLSIAYTYPTIVHSFDQLPGLGLNYVLLANTSLIREGAGSGLWPLFFDRIFYPFGYSIHEGFLPSVLIMLGGGNDILGVNISIFLSFWLASLGAYLLAYEATQHHIGSFLAGFYFGFCPQHLAHLTTYPIFHIEWLPWFFFALLRYRKSGRIRWAVVLSLAFLASALCSWYFFIFLLLAFGIYVVLNGRSMRNVILPTVGIFLACLLLIPFTPILLIGEYGLSTGGFRYLIDGSADLLSFFIPASFHWWFGPRTSALQETWLGNPSLRSNFLGLLSFGVALLGIFYARSLASRFIRRYFLTLVIVFWVLALGPFLVVGGLPAGLSPNLGEQLPNWRLPYFWLSDFLPFSVTRATARYSIITTLGLSVFFALGTRKLLERVRPTAMRSAMVVVIFVATFAEFWPEWPLRLESLVPPSPFYSQLDDSSASIVELPLRSNAYRIMYCSTRHQNPVIGGAVDKPFARFAAKSTDYPFLRQLVLLNTPAASQDSFWDIHIEPEGAYFPDVLGALRVQYLIVHKFDQHILSFGDYFVADPAYEVTKSFLEPWFESVYEDDSVRVYQPREVSEAPLFPVFGPNWGPPEQHKDHVSRPLLAAEGVIEIHSSRPERVRVNLEIATLYVKSRSLKVSVNAQPLFERQLHARREEDRWLTLNLTGVELVKGINLLSFSSDHPAVSSSTAHGGSDTRTISFVIRNLSVSLH